MFKNYFKIATRNLFRHKLFSLVNILCLSIGITFAMIIGVFVFQQKRINGDLNDAGNQYFIKSNWRNKALGMDITTLGPLAKTMKNEYPTLVANYYRFNPCTNVVSAGDKHFKTDISICDTTLISVYGLPLLYGNKDNAFPNTSSALISETMAMKLYGRKDALGKTVSMQTLNGPPQDYQVSGVLKDMPFNTITGMFAQTRFGLYVPNKGNRYYPTQDGYYQGGDGSESWTSWSEVSLLELKKGVTPDQLTRPFDQVLKKYTSKDVQTDLKIELSQLRTYFTRDNENKGATGRMITTLSLVAFFIVLMAIINFINIHIGTSAYRLKEIGLRKVFGGERAQLMVQFILESFTLTLLAGLISLGLYELLRPVFDNMLSLQLDPIWRFDWTTTLYFILLVLTIGVIAGIYPAFVLSASKIIHSVKGKTETAKGGLGLRRALLVIQFTLAVIIFIGAMTVSRQVSFAFTKDMGYNKDQLLVMTPFPKEWDSTGVAKIEAIKQGLLELPAVSAATLSAELPEEPPGSQHFILQGSKGGLKNNQVVDIPSFTADEDYARTFGLHLIEGKFFNDDHGAHRPNQIVLNESAVRIFGWKTALGKTVQPNDPGPPLTVVGVVRDFQYANLQEAITPAAFINMRDAPVYRHLTIKLNTPDIAAAIRDIRAKWKALSPNSPFEYVFMDDRFKTIYSMDLQLRNAARIATVLNLLIIFMGIFGVVAFTLVKRGKEMAIRKVLGADVRHIILLFIRDYAWLILIANIIGWPVAYSLTGKWLQSFAYRTPQEFGPYLFVFVFILLGVSVLVAVQCMKMALETPVQRLKAE